VRYSNPSGFSVAAGRAATTGLLLGLVLFLSAPSYALDETRADLRLSVSDDFVHARGSVLVSARYGGSWGARLGFWARESNVEPSSANFFVGVDHVWTYSKWRAGLGAVWIDKVNDLNGTHLDFDVSLGYDLSSRVFVEYRHHSHGRKLGISKDASNDGWNLIGIGLIF
jgi:hypothetical protein